MGDAPPDGVTVARLLGQNPDGVFKTLVAKGASGGYYVFGIPVAATLDLKKAARSVGEKSVEMLPVKEINNVTGYVRGGCTSIGMKKQYVTRIADTAKTMETIIVSGGRLGSQIEIRPEDLIRAAGAEFGDVLK